MRKEVNKAFDNALKKQSNIPASGFIQEVTGTSKVFGRDANITVAFEGSEAHTDGNTIVYPALDHSAILSKKEVLIGRGYCDHESAHIRHTDMPFYIEKATKAHEEGNTLLVDMMNAVEDVRIERLVNDIYKGAKKNLSATADAAAEYYLDEHKKDSTIGDNVGVAPLTFTWKGRQDMSYNSPNIVDAANTVPEDLQKATDKWVRDLDKCENTQDAYELARKICHDLQEENYKKPDYEDKETGEGCPEEQEGGSPEEGEQQKGKGGAPKEGEDEKEEQEGASPEESGDSKYSPDLGKIMNNTFQNLKKPSWGTYKPLTTRYDLTHTVHDAPVVEDPENEYVNYVKKKGHTGTTIMKKNASLKNFKKLLKKGDAAINVMRRKLEKAIQAKRRHDWDHSKEFGKLDSRRLTAAYNWQPNVFKVREDAPALDTAVSILVDLSGSMNGRKAEVATQVSCALFECLHRIGVPFEVVGFNNLNAFKTMEEQKAFEALEYEERGHNGFGSYSRVTPLQFYVFKSFKDKPVQAKEVIPTIQDCVGGHNTDGEALNIANERLRQRPEQRKILIVLSDGQPAADGPGGVQKTFLRNQVHRIEMSGTDLIGVGIRSEAVKNYYPKWTVCYDLEDLSKSTMDMLAKALMGEDFNIDNTELIALKEGQK